ncbi:MAG: alpha/beta fold hydrolase, partial [Brasilonema sp.]
MVTTERLTLTHAFDKLTWTWRGHKIQYTVMGVGQPLLLIHGFGASIGHWRKNIPMLAQKGYRVFALDLLGFGGSNKPTLHYT